MSEQPEGSAQGDRGGIETARQRFRDALIHAHQSREYVAELDAAAAQFCEALRREGHAPERMLIDAKAVIHAAIDGDDVAMAERAVTTCIRHYYQV